MQGVAQHRCHSARHAADAAARGAHQRCVADHEFTRRFHRLVRAAMKDHDKFDPTRRQLLKSSGIAGLSALGALNLLNTTALAQGVAEAPMNTGVLGSGPLRARAKRVIHLHMLGAMSHVDTFDYKPVLTERTGQELPPSVKDSQRISTMSSGQSAFPIKGPIAKFARYGQSGAWVSDLLPHTAKI